MPNDVEFGQTKLVAEFVSKRSIVGIPTIERLQNINEFIF